MTSCRRRLYRMLLPVLFEVYGAFWQEHMLNQDPPCYCFFCCLFCYHCCNDYHCYPHHYLFPTNQVVALWRYRKKAANGAPFVYECSELVPCASEEEQTVWRWTAAFPTLPYPIPSYSYLPYPTPSHPILPYPPLSHPILFTLSNPLLPNFH